MAFTHDIAASTFYIVISFVEIHDQNTDSNPDFNPDLLKSRILLLQT